MANNGTWAIFMQEVSLETLTKGSFITPETLERVTGYQRNTKEYEIQVLRVRSLVSAYFDGIGAPVTIKTEQDGLRILTDSEATEYNHSQFKIRMRGMFECARRMSNVVEEGMSEAQKKEHRAKLNAQAHCVGALAQQNKTLKLIPYSRSAATLKAQTEECGEQ